VNAADAKALTPRGEPRPAPGGWREAIGKLEIAGAVLFLLWRLLGWAYPGGALAVAAGLAFLGCAVWLAFRWTRRLLRFALWRLRNRLLLSYIFIAVVPVFLLGVLGLFGAWALSGQVAVYLVSQQFRQDQEFLRSGAAALLEHSGEIAAAPPARSLSFLTARFPGARVLLTEGSRDLLRWPAGEAASHAAAEEPLSGLVVQDGLLYSAAHMSAAGRRVSILTPVSKQYLQELIPGLGEITLVDLSAAAAASGAGRMRLHAATAASVTVPDDSAPPTSIAPALNRLDVEVLWGMPLSVTHWSSGSPPSQALLGVHTRISQVFRVIFSQKADWDQPWLIYAFYLVAILFLFVELVSLVIGLSITRTMTLAVHHLYEGTQRVQAGDFTYRIPVNGSDQLSDLGRSYNVMIENLDRLLKVAKEKERLQADLDIGREVQAQLYPHAEPTVQGLEIVTRLTPARSVSGDYFDYQRAGASQFVLALGDVAGKGISAAILMASIQSALRNQLRFLAERDLPINTASVVSHINKHLQANTSPEKYATLFFALYDESSGLLTYTNAGHLPPILIRGGKPQRLDVNGMVVGVFPLAAYGASSVELQRGDILLLYTDGISEPENEYEEMFGEDRLVDTVLQCGPAPAAAIADAVFEAVRAWTFEPDHADDMTLMVIRKIA
jgi:phosphoserine phosphatase RsbU/P